MITKKEALKEATGILEKEFKRCKVRLPQRPKKPNFSKFNPQLLKIVRNDFAQELKYYRDYKIIFADIVKNIADEIISAA